MNEETDHLCNSCQFQGECDIQNQPCLEKMKKVIACISYEKKPEEILLQESNKSFFDRFALQKKTLKERLELRKKYPNCHVCQAKLVPDTPVMGIFNSEAQIEGYLCSRKCSDIFMEDWEIQETKKWEEE